MAEKEERPTLYLDYEQIRVDMGDHHITFVRGDELVDVPDGTMESMVALGYAKPQCELAQLQPAENESELDLLAKPIVDLEVDASVVRALTEAGLTTVADVLHDAEANQGLTHIKGIGEKTEKEVKEALTRLLAPAE